MLSAAPTAPLKKAPAPARGESKNRFEVGAAPQGRLTGRGAGDRDSVLGFKALGLDIVPVEGVEEGRHALHKLAKEEYAIIYVTEQLAQSIRADIDRYKTSVTPAVILIPWDGTAPPGCRLTRRPGRCPCGWFRPPPAPA